MRRMANQAEPPYEGADGDKETAFNGIETGEMPSMPPLDSGERHHESGLRPRQTRAIEFVRSHGFITNKYYSKFNEISERQALRELNEMVDSGDLDRIGKGRACRYVLKKGCR